MEINRKALASILSQIVPHQSVVVLQDSKKEGCIDILYLPQGTLDKGILNIVTINATSNDTDIFGTSPHCNLGGSIAVTKRWLNSIVKFGKGSCVIEKDRINGKRLEALCPACIDVVIKINDLYHKYTDNSNSEESPVQLDLSSDEYNYIASEYPKYALHPKSKYDTDRSFLESICFDVSQDGINVVSTDGKKLLVSTLKAKNNYSQEFIVPIDCFFLPSATYSHVNVFLKKWEYSVISIKTEYYEFHCHFKCIDAVFVEYRLVIPEITSDSQFLVIDCHSLKDSAQKARPIQESSIIITVNEDLKIDASIENLNGSGKTVAIGNIKGQASRPMKLRVNWELFNIIMGNSISIKMYIKNTQKPIISSTLWAGMKVTKVFMPCCILGDGSTDDWGFPIEKGDAK